MATLSLVTASLNPGKNLDDLATLLENQTSKQFEWVVADGGSTDGSIQRLAARQLPFARILHIRDFGIYDAMNQAIKATKTTHYVVFGSDDRPDPKMVENYLAALQGEVDVVAACVREGGVLVKPGSGRSWLRAQRAYIAHHSLGVAIRTQLHEQHGYYSRKFPIAADQLFIKRVFSSPKVKCVNADFIAGDYGVEGTSSQDALGAYCEIFRIQLQTEPKIARQYALFIYRLVRHYFRSHK